MATPVAVGRATTRRRFGAHLSGNVTRLRFGLIEFAVFVDTPARISPMKTRRGFMLAASAAAERQNLGRI
jgi:hypothetical protein